MSNKTNNFKDIVYELRKKQIDRFTHKLDKRISQYLPIFEDYLNGMLVSEIAIKNNTTRYQIYSLLNRYNIPRRETSDLKLYYARRMLQGDIKKQNKFDKDNCQCFICNWLRKNQNRELIGAHI